MAIVLSADARTLTEEAKYSYLSSNENSGVSSFVLVNSNGFAANDYILLGEFGGEQSEIVQVSTVTSSTHTIALVAATVFAHPESTRVTIIPYNQVRYYWTATATYATTTLLTTIDIQADSDFTKYSDSAHSTGFGWFIFYNATTSGFSTNSNAIPYAGFETGSVKEIIDAFFSTLNNKEQKLVSIDDAFRWLNEAYSLAQNELNLVNDEFTVPTPASISVTSGTAEYDLSSYQIGNIVSVYTGTGSSGIEVEPIDLKDVQDWNQKATTSAYDVRYYLRGSYIGFSPSPTSSATYSVYYEAKSTVLTSFYDNITLPDNQFYFLVDFMLFRASEKLPRIGGAAHYQKFEKDLQRMKLVSFKRSNHPDSWEVDGKTLV